MASCLSKYPMVFIHSDFGHSVEWEVGASQVDPNLDLVSGATIKMAYRTHALKPLIGLGSI
jgi:hypothetical protein